MLDTDRIKQLVDDAVGMNPDLFLIGLNVSPANAIIVEVDGDKGVPLSECIRISREIEQGLDRETTDFSLEVTTPDVSKPLKLRRQYTKNIGRKLQVKTSSGEVLEGNLTSVQEDSIQLEWKAREPKPVGKGKRTVTKTANVLFENIEEAKVKLLF
jgi:ribosome maturation factor RimP